MFESPPRRSRDMLALGRHLQENLGRTRTEVREIGERASSLAPDGLVSFEELKELYGLGSGGSSVKGCEALVSIVGVTFLMRFLM